MSIQHNLPGGFNRQGLVLVRAKSHLGPFTTSSPNYPERHLEPQWLPFPAVVLEHIQGIGVLAAYELLRAALDTPHKSTKYSRGGLEGGRASIASAIRTSDGGIGKVDFDMDGQWRCNGGKRLILEDGRQ